MLIPRIAGVVADSPAAAAGFQTGDLVVSIDGQALDSFADMQRIVSASGGMKLHFVIDRAGKRLELDATPVRQGQRDAFRHLSAAACSESWRAERGKIGARKPSARPRRRSRLSAKPGA